MSLVVAFVLWIVWTLKSTSCRHCLHLITLFTSFVDIAVLHNIESTSCQHRLHSNTLFTLFTSLILQWCTLSNQHRVYVAYITIPCLHRSHRQHRSTKRSWIIFTFWTLQCCLFSNWGHFKCSNLNLLYKLIIY